MSLEKGTRVVLRVAVPGARDVRPEGTVAKIVGNLGEGSLDHDKAVADLLDRLEAEGRSSSLRDMPSSRAALSDFLIRLRLASR